MSEFRKACDGGIVHRTLDTDREEPSVQIAEVVAELKGVDATALSSIYDNIDHLITHLFDTPPRPEAQATVRFHYEGYQIEVHQGGDATFLKT